MSISVINDNSQSAQVIEILSVRDAERIWGFMINKVGGGKPTSLRMEEIYKDFFGNPGVYSALVREFADEEQVQSISTSSCQRRAESEFKRKYNNHKIKYVPTLLKELPWFCPIG